MRVLVTGGTGLIGSAICEHLVNMGNEVICLNLNKNSQLTHATMLYSNLDVGKQTFSEEAFAMIDPCSVIIHAAANKHYGLYEPSIIAANCLGTQQLLKLAQMWNAKNFIFISSVPVIGKPKEIPITESHPTDPPSAYHASKLFGEHLVTLAQTDKMQTVSLRIPSPIGANFRAKTIVYAFIENALRGSPIELYGKGSRRQNYVDVRDIATAVHACISRNAAGIFNIANSETISNLELAETCIDVLKSQTKITFINKADPEDEVTWDISIRKAQEELGYQPRYKIQDSIKSVVESYENRNY